MMNLLLWYGGAWLLGVWTVAVVGGTLWRTGQLVVPVPEQDLDPPLDVDEYHPRHSIQERTRPQWDSETKEYPFVVGKEIRSVTWERDPEAQWVLPDVPQVPVRTQV